MMRGISKGEMMRYCSSVGRREKGWNVVGNSRLGSMDCSSTFWSSDWTPEWHATSVELERRLRVSMAITRFGS